MSPEDLNLQAPVYCLKRLASGAGANSTAVPIEPQAGRCRNAHLQRKRGAVAVQQRAEGQRIARALRPLITLSTQGNATAPTSSASADSTEPSRCSSGR